jgi:hemolysin D
MRALTVLREAVALERLRPKVARNRSELAFLPAALEVVETPPHPAARILAWTLTALLLVAIIWAWLGFIDVTAVAEGRTIVSGRSKVVQAAEPGIVRAILVRDGAQVRAGDVLIELDLTTTGAEREKVAQELMSAQVSVARLHALLAAPKAADALAAFVPPTGADAALVRITRDLLESEALEQEAKQAQLEDEIRRKQAERAAAEAVISRLDQAIPLLAERAVARRTLANQGFGSRLTYLEVQQQLVESEQDRIIQRYRVAEIDAAILALESQRRSVEAEFRRGKASELAETERRAVSLQQEVIKADQRHSLQTVTAPIDGTVQQLAVNTLGGVVTAAQNLMVVVPLDEGLEIEAMVANRDIGFVRPGQLAQIKIETFTFTRYGLVEGEVVHVSNDAIQDEKKGLVYAARIRLKQHVMRIDGRDVALGAGMNATVEILTDRRRVIEFLLSPLLRMRHDAMRER